MDIQYERNDLDFHRGTFRVRGDMVEIFPAYEEERAIRVELFGDEVEAIQEIDPLRGRALARASRRSPSSPPATTSPRRRRRSQAIAGIREELRERLAAAARPSNKLLEAQRLEQRTLFDLEMIEQMGVLHRASRTTRAGSLAGRPGEPPPCLLDYFPKDFLLVIDETHQTVPQIGAMYHGDRSRKETLVEYGFRLPSALDNRPLKFDEFERLVRQAIYVSATPAEYELERAQGWSSSRSSGPPASSIPRWRSGRSDAQVDDLLDEIRKRAEAGERVLVTTLTKRMAEDLTEYYRRRRRQGPLPALRHRHARAASRSSATCAGATFDVLVGINLLREGLDIPEVSLVAMLDADKEGFLRSRGLAHPDHRPGRPQHRRAGDPVRRPESPTR